VRIKEFNLIINNFGYLFSQKKSFIDKSVHECIYFDSEYHSKDTTLNQFTEGVWWFCIWDSWKSAPHWSNTHCRPRRTDCSFTTL